VTAPATSSSADPEQELVALRREGELAAWAPAGRDVRPGTWAQQAIPTPDAIEEAVADGRLGDAARLARHLVVEAQEIHDLYTAWARDIPGELRRLGVPARAPPAARAHGRGRPGGRLDRLPRRRGVVRDRL
jgi:hypothetical protein